VRHCWNLFEYSGTVDGRSEVDTCYISFLTFCISSRNCANLTSTDDLIFSSTEDCILESICEVYFLIDFSFLLKSSKTSLNILSCCSISFYCLRSLSNNYSCFYYIFLISFLIFSIVVYSSSIILIISSISFLCLSNSSKVYYLIF
jgi:hypothetical protein